MNTKDEKLEELILTLSEGERKILKLMANRKIKEIYEEDLSKQLEMDLSEVSRYSLWLENKGVINKLKESKPTIELTEKGKQYVNRPLPEAKILGHLKEKQQEKIDKLPRKLGIDLPEINAAIGLLIKNGLIKINKKEKIIEITPKGKQIRELPTVATFKALLKTPQLILSNREKDPSLQNLVRRGLIRFGTTIKWKIALTELGERLIKKGIPEIEHIDRVTPEIISSKTWKTKRLRWYDILSPVPKVWGGRKHPLKLIIEKIRQVFLEMGFREMKGPWVETAFWNMDSMWIPQDHPARELQATFYISKPPTGNISDKELIKIVKDVQETGGDTSSIGWQQEWSEREALKTLLRTHTTAVTFRVLGFKLRNGELKPPVKFFAIDRVFRNETIDWKHLAEFHQVEGFVVAENLTLRSLMGYIKEFYWKMGIKKLRFKPTYNPYTEPSMEVFAWHSEVGKWVEVGNSGLFRPETLRPYNIAVPVIAWGLAVERLAMLLYGIEDIREVFGSYCDINWLRWYQLPLKRVFK